MGDERTRIHQRRGIECGRQRGQQAQMSQGRSAVACEAAAEVGVTWADRHQGSSDVYT